MKKDDIKQALTEMLKSGEIKFETRSDLVCDIWRLEKLVVIDGEKIKID